MIYILRNGWKGTADEKVRELLKENDEFRSILELVACSKRSDGTYNRCREACEELAKLVLDRNRGEK